MRTGRTVRALSGLKFASAPCLLANGWLALRVVFIRPGSPAARAGLLPGDILLSAAGLRLRRTVDFRAILRSRVPPFTLNLIVMRDGQRRRTRLAIPATPAIPAIPATPTIETRSGDTPDGQ